MRGVRWALPALVSILLICPRAASGQEWKISGKLLDACSCNVGCPCSFGSPPTHNFCKKTLLFDIAAGKYGKIDLSKLRFAAAAELGAWVIFYVDEKASAEQKTSLERIFNVVLKPIAPDVVGVKSVTIKTHYQRDRMEANIPNILTLSMESVLGWDGTTPMVVINPKSRPLLPEYTVARSIIHTFQDHGKKWDFGGKSGFHGDFIYSSELAQVGRVQALACH